MVLSLQVSTSDAMVAQFSALASCPANEGVLAVKGNGALDRVVIHFDLPIDEEQAKTGPIFCDVFQRLTQGGFGGYLSSQTIASTF